MTKLSIKLKKFPRKQDEKINKWEIHVKISEIQRTNAKSKKYRQRKEITKTNKIREFYGTS